MNSIPMNDVSNPSIERAQPGFNEHLLSDLNRAGISALQSPARIPAGKRALDLTLIFLTSPLWLPVMVLVSMWILVVSRGPIFYRQERIGFLGRKFFCLKFRSMKIGADTGHHEAHVRSLMDSERPMTKLDAAGDSRLIPWGRLFRASGLDELPQIFNVLRGEMSLVGPRPCIPLEFEHNRALQEERVNALPGLTGHWQVNGKNKTTFSEMVAMDIHYVRNASLRGDCTIICKTFPVILTQISDLRSNASVRRPAVACEAA